MKKYLLTIKIPVLLLLVAMCAMGCISDIDIELNNDNRLVINGNIGYQIGQSAPSWQYVQIYYSVGFLDNIDSRRYVDNATVTISDINNNEFTLDYRDKGVYAKEFWPVPNNRYTLRVLLDGQEYQAVDSLKYPISITQTLITDGGVGFDGTNILYPTVEFVDPGGEKNYYSIDILVGDAILSEGRIPRFFNDILFNGSRTAQLPAHSYGEFSTTGGSMIRLSHISEAAYIYEATGTESNIGGGFFDRLPSVNLRGNIRNITSPNEEKSPYGFFRTVAFDQLPISP